MSRLIDLTGKRFGHLIVVRRGDDNVLPSGLREPMWVCRCDCGNETVVRGSFLRSGHTKSCGCRKTGENFVDLTGKQFGDVVVLERIPNTLPTKWRCRCICGREFVTRGTALTSGHTKSCGCRKKQLRIKDMVGRKFGRLTVVRRGPDEQTKNGTRYIRWICQCDCGRVSLVRGTSLRNGHVKSCGCARAEGVENAPTSWGEIWVSEWLAEHGFKYAAQKSFNGLVSESGRLLFFDFAVDCGNRRWLLIECQGIQHFQPIEWFGGVEQFERQLDNDERKREYVKRHKALRLIELRYVSRMSKSEFLADLECQIGSMLGNATANECEE